MIPGNLFNNSDIEKDLTDLPEIVSKALETWRIATLDRKKTDAMLYMKYRMSDMGKRTTSEIKAMIDKDDTHYAACLMESKLEADYNFLYERLLSAKKRASLRTAF